LVSFVRSCTSFRCALGILFRSGRLMKAWKSSLWTCCKWLPICFSSLRPICPWPKLPAHGGNQNWIPLDTILVFSTLSARGALPCVVPCLSPIPLGAAAVPMLDMQVLSCALLVAVVFLSVVFSCGSNFRTQIRLPGYCNSTVLDTVHSNNDHAVQGAFTSLY